MKNKKIKISYYKGNNFGDDLGPYIVTKLSGLETQYKEIVLSPLRMILRIIKNVLLLKFHYLKQIKYISFDKKVLVPIGSTIARGNKNTSHWGTGFLTTNQTFGGGVTHAIRGKLTDKKLRKDGFTGCSVYGDPALLLPLIFTAQVEKTNEVGIIPHYLDLLYFQTKYSNRYKIIDLTINNVEKTISEICSCKKILSTSLHGIIVAQAYNIPALWIKKGNIGTDGFKFKDYFSSVEIKEYNGFTDIDKILESIDSVNELFENNKDLSYIHVDLSNIQRNLIKAAPFCILEKYKQI